MVIDASAVVEMLLRTPAGAAVERHLEGAPDVVAPELLDAEVLHALRRLVRERKMTDRRAGVAVHRLSRLPVLRVSHQRLLIDAWQLRHNLSAYDALYVALARRTGTSLLTLDRRIAGAPGLGASVTVVSV